MRKNTLSVHSENILPIIKKWLYSSRDIFLRELISNSCDAIKKLRVLRECGQAPLDDEPFSIHVHFDKKNQTLTISDNGIGMTEEEVEKYIAQIAFSSAEEFVTKYKEQNEKDPMIGHFGLGFYSAYMVATRVVLQTHSYLPETPAVEWNCDGTSSYEIGPGNRETRGTDVILHLDPSSKDWLTEEKVRELLLKFCNFMPDPIFFNGEPLGNEAPLWLKSSSDCTDAEVIDFYRKLYPNEPDPLFWIHLNVDYPFRLKGILYFPKNNSYLRREAHSIKLFCNRVFVSDDCREFLPEYLTTLSGAIDSPDIPLNVSRSYLQVDENVRQLGAHISKKVADRISTLFHHNRESYITYWPELELLLKLGLLHDDKFYERVHSLLIWKTSSGEWTTLQELLDRSKEKKVYYCTKDSAVVIQKAYLDRGIELIYTNHAIDTAVILRLEEKASIRFQRIDSAIDPTLFDTTREKTLLGADGKTDAAHIAALFRSHLSLEVEAKSLSADGVAGVLLIDEDLRRMRDYFALTRQETLPHLANGKRSFLVNTNNKLVQTAWRLADKKPELVKQIVTQIYDLARAMQKEIEPSELDGVLLRNQELLEELSSLVT
jgi:molecular chaperone HtpG